MIPAAGALRRAAAAAAMRSRWTGAVSVAAARAMSTSQATSEQSTSLFDSNMEMLHAANLVAKTEATTKVRELALKMQSEGISPDVNTFNALIFAYSRSGLMHHAVDMYDQLRALKLRPTIATYNLLLKVSSTRGDVWRCFQLMQDLINDGVEPTVESYQHLLVACQISGDTHASVRVLEDLLSSNLSEIPLGMYDRVLAQLVESQLVDQALDVYRMLESVAEPFPVAQMRILHALMNTDRATTVRDIATRLFSSGAAVPDGLLIDLLYYSARYGLVSVAEKSLASLQAASADEPLPAYHYGAVAQAYASNSQWRDVFRFFRAVAPLVKRDEAALTMPVGELMGRDAAAVDEAYYALESMAAAGEEIPQMAYHVILNVCGFKLIDPNRTFDTFDAFIKMGMHHHVVAYEPLLYICFKFNLRDQAAKQLAAMKGHDVTLSQSCYSSLVKMAITSGELTTAMYYVGQSLLRSRHGDATVPKKTLYSLINLCLTKDPAKLPIVIEFADQQGVGVFARTLAQKLAAQPGKPHAPRRRRSPRSLDEEDAMDASMEAAIRDELAGGESGARQ